MHQAPPSCAGGEAPRWPRRRAREIRPARRRRRCSAGARRAARGRAARDAARRDAASVGHT
eukprot:scaffold2580_cov388-Prasinococcus_capsulatus_cf.AAC.9